VNKVNVWRWLTRRAQSLKGANGYWTESGYSRLYLRRNKLYVECLENNFMESNTFLQHLNEIININISDIQIIQKVTFIVAHCQKLTLPPTEML